MYNTSDRFVSVKVNGIKIETKQVDGNENESAKTTKHH